jgi:4-hydroxybenzoate polyprenyltransferase
LLIFKSKAFEYLRTSRLSAWLIATVFFLLGVWHSTGRIPFYHSIIAILALGGIQSSASWVNFVYDKELDKFAGDDVSFFKYVSSRELLYLSLSLSIISLILLFYLSYLMFIVGLLIVIVGVVYSVPPLRFKVHPPLDCVANALEFGVLPTLLGFIYDKYLDFNFTFFVLLIISGLLVVSYFLFLDILDMKTDKDYGIETSVTVLGIKGAVNLGLIMFFFSVILSLVFFGFLSLTSISLLICSPIIVIIKIKNDYESIVKILSSISLVWTESVLLLLYFLSGSIIPLIISVLVLLSAFYFLYVYLFIMKK